MGGPRGGQGPPSYPLAKFRPSTVVRPPLLGLTHDLWGKSTYGGWRPIVGGPRGQCPLVFHLPKFFRQQEMREEARRQAARQAATGWNDPLLEA